MKFLLAMERPPYPFFLGGAARCAHQLLLKLSDEFQAQCAAFGSADYSVTPWSYPPASEHAGLGIRSIDNDPRGGLVDCSYPVRVVRDFEQNLDALIDEFRPDIVWAQLEGARAVLELAHRKGIQGVYFVHDAETNPTELRLISDLGCHIVCSSAFLAGRVQKVVGRQVHVVYPCPQLYFDTKSDRSGYITMINPQRVKGLHTFLEIARSLPAEEFLLLESWKLGDQPLAELQAQLRTLPNVRFLRRVSDVRPIYAKTGLLLVPSIWEEGFGMVAVEAQSCGIPVVASARGGLPESVGDGGLLISDYLNAAAWVDAILTLRGNSHTYDELAARALANARSDVFSAAHSARRFLDICSGSVSQQGTYARNIGALVGALSKVPVLRALVKSRSWQLP